ncbi:uncharacterized protein LOC109841513 [Asparagus officinalis]|uniref:uncharacterized protein LOC109841513 n=1 Tax=Asparagus officinalis TaxID=4686 RepID=UPI00098E66C7|nr:uncharacterized protein LOC109841513 [Asparagus officinalis]
MAGAILPGNISDVNCDIPELKGDNYKVWKERVLLQLGWMDIDYAIRKDEPPGITETSTPDAVDLYEKWERSNRLSVMFIKTKICASIRGFVDKHTKVKDLLDVIDEQFATSDKALASTLIMKFSSMRHNEFKCVHDYIMRMRDIAAQLKDLEVTMSDSFLVHFILCTLPPQYGPFKISYNTHKDKWSINELMTMCVQEEGRLRMEEGEKVNLTTASSSKKRKDHIEEKGKGKITTKQGIKKESACFFCKKKGHMKKYCIKFKTWLEKKSNFLAFVYESNMVNVNHNTWWIDSGTTIYVSNTLQDFGFSILRNSEVIGYSILSDGLYRLCLQNDIAYSSMHVSTRLKRCIMNEDSSILWHRRLGHISIERVKRLVKDGVLGTLDFTDFDTCVSCIKGKQTNKYKIGAKRSSNLLEIIHTDICCPDMNANEPKYFITFIDDYSRYMCLYLLRSKDEALDAFKLFKAEVEKQCDKHIKIVRSDRGGEYYGRYTENGQAPGLYARFLQEHGIVAQYTMFGSPDQNGVAERRNQTFIGYAERSKGYRFYCPSHSTRIVESRNAKFLENDLISGSDQFRDIVP